MVIKSKIKKGDKVKVLRGKDRGKIGKVLHVSPGKELLMVEGVQIVKKHVRSRQTKGNKAQKQRVEVATFIPVAKVQVVCPECGKATRLGIVEHEGKRTRMCKKCEATLP